MAGAPRPIRRRKRRARPLKERLFPRLIINPETGCLLWTGAISGGGYGYISMPGRKLLRVHRVMYELFVGPIPDGMVLDHLCRVRRCASPAHLEAVTHRTNTLRGESPAAIAVAMNACDRGHEFDLINTYWTPDGKRHCRACILIRRERARETQAS